MKAKLYRSSIHASHWIAHTEETGWVMFPAQQNGWEKRIPCRGIDPIYLREVPLRLAMNTGLIEFAASMESAAA